MEKMVNHQLSWFYSMVVLLAFSCNISWAHLQEESYLSPEFVMKPGSVIDRFYPDIDFPRGHIGIKSFNAEVVDETGSPVPLHDTYLHHWVVVRYYKRIGVEDRYGLSNNLEPQNSDYGVIRNSGLCKNIPQYFGLGSETRKTATNVPDPYAIEIGNPEEIPPGYEERWMLNVHAIDTRGVVDRLGCTECRCHLYNVTEDEYGRPLSSDYEGGLKCCYDQTQCKVKEGFTHSTRRLYLKYTVKWVDWSKSLLPVKIYIFDVTDAWKTSQDTSSSIPRHSCKVEYEIKRCESSANGCIDTKRTSFILPRGGHVIYGVAHQHSGGIGSALYGEDGRLICSSTPSYGLGNEAGNEAGYIVGMSTCYPQPGSIDIHDGEMLVVESNYSSSQKHTGVMGLFYILVADQLPSQNNYFEALIHKVDGTVMPVSVGAVVIFGLMLFAIVIAVAIWRMNPAEDGYRPISI